MTEEQKVTLDELAEKLINTHHDLQTQLELMDFPADLRAEAEEYVLESIFKCPLCRLWEPVEEMRVTEDEDVMCLDCHLAEFDRKDMLKWGR